MAARFSFSQTSISSLPLPKPEEGRATYHDVKTPGLQIRVSSAGAKVFSLHRRVRRSKLVRVTLGPFPAVSVELARLRALELIAKTVQGIDPTAELKEARGIPSFGAVFKRYVSEYSKQHNRTWKEDEAKYEQHLKKPLGSKAVGEVTRSDIISLHASISTKAPIAANRVVALISAVFNWAKDMELATSNPAQGVRRNREKDRSRFMSEEELGRFWAALGDEPDATLRDFFTASLLTAARRTNVLEMRWDQIDFSTATWSIPQTKNGEPQVVPLSSHMIDVLRCRSAEKRGPWVFPGKGVSGHLVEPKSAWKALCKRAGLNDLRLHDLRRTNATWQLKGGTSLPDVQKSLNHKTIQATLKYARADLVAVKKSSQRVSEQMLAVALKTQADPTDAITSNGGL